MIDNISKRLFSKNPTDTLYHYTSLGGLMGIIDSRYLRASDVRFMNDSTELRHTLDLLRRHIERRIRSGTDHPQLMTAMLEWLSHRVVGGPMIFAASFRANGNLLSQWRGYSAHGKGVSLGFAPEHIQRCAEQQDFLIGRCIYASDVQQQLIEQIADGIESEATRDDATGDEAYSQILEQNEEALLSIAAMLKHPAFEEEDEWRVVSPRIVDLHRYPVGFREGSSMLVPYYRFDLSAGQPSGIPLEHLFIGPSGNAELSMTSIDLYLESRNARPKHGISDCEIPYRKR
jgi:hypothetical protein